MIQYGLKRKLNCVLANYISVAREKVGQQFRTAISQIDPTRHVRKRQRQRKSSKASAGGGSVHRAPTTAEAAAIVAAADESSEAGSQKSDESSSHNNSSSSLVGSDVPIASSGQQKERQEQRPKQQKLPSSSESAVTNALSAQDRAFIAASSVSDNGTMPRPPPQSEHGVGVTTPRIRNAMLSPQSTGIEDQKLPVSNALAHLADIAGSKEALQASSERQHQQLMQNQSLSPPKSFRSQPPGVGLHGGAGMKQKTTEWYLNYYRSQI